MSWLVPFEFGTDLRYHEAKMRIFTLFDSISDWYPQKAMSLFQRYSSFEFVNNPKDAQIIWIFSYYLPLGDNIRKECSNGRPVITSINHLYPPREPQFRSKLKQLNEISDFIHFFSKKTAEESKSYFSSPLILLPYWIDLTLFHPLPLSRRRRIRQSLNLPQDKIIIGSFQRDTEMDLRSPKLEKGPDIFCDVIHSLDKDKYHVLLAGPRRNYVERRLKQNRFPFKSLGKVPYAQMNELYNCIDYYLVTSRCEGGPQSILEAMATKTKIYSTPVGISDLLSGKVICFDATQFITGLTNPYPDVTEQHYQTVQSFDCSKIIKRYEEVFTDLYRRLNGRRQQ